MQPGDWMIVLIGIALMVGSGVIVLLGF